ncbi:MAG: hypothetical protein ABSD42_05605 [Candidatus Bathyarchaeia archaeon]
MSSDETEQRNIPEHIFASARSGYQGKQSWRQEVEGTVKRRNAVLALAIVALLALSLFFAAENFVVLKNQVANQSGFYVGVECGYNNVTLCKALIDKVKNYTNLFVIGSTDIVKNESLLNEVVDYAYCAGMYFAVYFSPIQNYTDLGENATPLLNGAISQLSDLSSLPMAWLKNATSEYGDRFLGVYVFDEPGGNQLDGGVQRVADATSEQSYQSMANTFVGNLSAKIQPYLNSGVMTFTSDYGLYWFDYKAGYDAVLAEFGGNNGSRQLQISLCRGAATAQGKDWGIMVTTRSDNGQVMESGPELYDDLVLGYNSGAKYAIVFDYALAVSPSGKQMEPYQPYEYGILQDEHFEALKNFWTYVQQNPSKQGSLKADTALVLPQDFGFGFRNEEDTVWGVFNSDVYSQTMWADANSYLNQYGSRLDIVYDDPQFINEVKMDYATVINWTSGAAAEQ